MKRHKDIAAEEWKKRERDQQMNKWMARRYKRRTERLRDEETEQKMSVVAKKQYNRGENGRRDGASNEGRNGRSECWNNG